MKNQKGSSAQDSAQRGKSARGKAVAKFLAERLGLSKKDAELSAMKIERALGADIAEKFAAFLGGANARGEAKKFLQSNNNKQRHKI